MSLLLKFKENKLIFWAFFLLLVAFAVLRFRFTDIPLERDEGEYAYAGQLILQGIPPYQNLYNMKLPGIYGAYALLIALFGQSHMGIHFGLLLMILWMMVFVYLISREWMNSWAALFSMATFGLFTFSPKAYALSANAEYFALFFILPAILLFQKALSTKKLKFYFFAGLLLGISFLMKQHAIFFLVFYFIVTIKQNLKDRNLKNIGAYILGTLIPYLAICGLFLVMGIFEKFWFYTMVYARAYVSQMPLNEVWLSFKLQGLPVFSSIAFFWIIPILGLISLLVSKKIQNKFFLGGLLVFSFLSVLPGFYFRGHYFIFTFPIIAILSGVFLNQGMLFFEKAKTPILKIGLPVILAFLGLGFSFSPQSEFLFQMNKEQMTRHLFGLAPFQETLEISKYIRHQTKDSDKIGVLGSEPQIYFYTNRKSVTEFIYMYTFMERHEFAEEMQNELMLDFESEKPKYIIFVNTLNSWTGPFVRKDVVKWFLEDFSNQYHLESFVEMFGNESYYHWEIHPEIPKPRSRTWIGIYKYKGAA